VAATALRRPVAHDDRLSLVDHLDELRSRLIICVVAIVVLFALCMWQNNRLLTIVNHPLESQTQKQIKKGQGPLGELSKTQLGILSLARSDRAVLSELLRSGSGISAGTKVQLEKRLAALDATIASLPHHVAGNKPVTLGVGEPFTMTLMVAGLFALILAMPLILYEIYAFVLPAFTPSERRVALPLLLMIPGLFIAGVVFGYYLVLPAAVRFLQNFNTDEFNVLVQARDYYKFVALTLFAMGIVFQVPVAILALTRIGVVSVSQLRKHRRYAIVAIAVIAMILPGTDPVSMLIDMVPLIVLYEVSIVLASIFTPKPAVETVDPEEPDAV
jgi:sec-independent protein translocase protein TatC